MATSDKYIPPLSIHRLTPIYDGFLHRTMKENIFKPQLVAQAQLRNSHRVLDLGCGTGTLTLLIRQRVPGAEVIGFDADRRALAMAAAKADAAGLRITWEQGMAYALPYDDGSFDRVLTSLVLHHLNTDEKRRALKEVWRVLKPGGELHIADFGPPHAPAMKLVASVLRFAEETADNFAGHLPAMMQEAGLSGIREVSHFATIFGPMSLYRAARPHRQPAATSNEESVLAHAEVATLAR